MAETTDATKTYVFKRDYRSSIRLNLNHYLIREICGYLIHPSISVPTDARVADVGSGTGIWLFETAGKLPETAQFDGFDISTEQFPPKTWWPKNCSLIQHDVFKPFPEQYQGKYDLVNVRFFLCVINDDDAEPVLKNLVSLLKPGGYLQWLEPNANEAKMKSSNSDASSTAYVEQLANIWRKPRPTSSYNWLVSMPKHLESQGLMLQKREEYEMKDHLRLCWDQGLLAGLDDANPRSSKVTGTEKEDQMERLMGGLDKEFRDGVSIDVPFLCFVGSKM